MIQLTRFRNVSSLERNNEKKCKKLMLPSKLKTCKHED